jgi:Na+/proline symporter
MSNIMIASYGLFAGVLAIVLNNIGITIGYLYLLMGIIITSAVVPLSCTLLWKKQNWYAVILAPIIGQWSALISWLGTHIPICLICIPLRINDIKLFQTHF